MLHRGIYPETTIFWSGRNYMKVNYGVPGDCYSIIIMTSQWTRWRLKSPDSPLFTQPFISGADQRKYQSSASLAFVRGILRGPVNCPHKWPVTRKMFPFDDVIMISSMLLEWWSQHAVPKLDQNHFLVFSFAIHLTFLVLKPEYTGKLANTVSLYSSPSSAACMRRWSAIIGSSNGFSLVLCQAITWINAGALSSGLVGTNFSEIWIRILPFY